MKIAVAGGTGVVGAHLVDQLRARGHDVLVLARAAGVDLATGSGLDLTGADVVVDVVSTVTSSRRKAVDFFTTTTGHLLRAGAEAGVKHHVLLSIVGIDDVPFGYYQGKVAQESAVEAGPVPWTILRAPQFHEFAGQMLERASVGPIAIVPRMTSAPMAAAEVATRLAEIAEGAPQGRAQDLRGPEVLGMHDLVKQVARTTGPRKLVLVANLPGAAGRGMSGGALVATDPASVGTQTFQAWLEEQA